MKKICLLAVVLFSVVALSFSQEINFTGDLSTNIGAYVLDARGGNFSVGNINFNGAIEAYAANGTAYLEGDVEYDFLFDQFYFDLSESYIDYSSSVWGVRFGLQKVAWGKADGINITNSVFPKDSSSLFVDDDSVAIKGARFSLSGNLFTVDGFVIPFFTGTKLPLEEKNPLREKLVPSSVQINQGGTEIVLPVNIGNLNQPEFNFKNMEYGLKASGYFSFCDISLYGFYGWNKTPVLNYDLNKIYNSVYGVDVPESLTINGEYKKLGMVGLDFAIPIGPIVLRSECAYFPNREFQSSSEFIMSGNSNSVKQHQFVSLAGIDYMTSGWTITAQYYGDVIFNKSEDIERSEPYEHGATLSISKSLLNETLEISVSGLMGFNYFDSAINVESKYSLNDQIGISLGAYAFLPGPEQNGTYGNYKDFSSVYLKVNYKW